MLNNKCTLMMLVLLLCAGGNLFSQVNTRTDVLRQAAVEQAQKEKDLQEKLDRMSAEKGWPKVIQGKNGRYGILAGIDMFGYPVYLCTDNDNSAATTRTDRLWPGGSTGLNLTGSSDNIKGKLAIWDGGKIRDTHVELTGRVTTKDGTTTLSDHATHVAGTMIASGIYGPAKGMAYGLKELLSYDFGSHMSEILSQSPVLLASNHSYGTPAGWFFNEGQNRWEFHGLFGANEDFKFGYYNTDAQLWDSIAYNAPNYLIVKSVGNNRDENGPAVGSNYWRYNASGVMADAGNRPAGISDNSSYETISTYGVAKNILTVGAIEPLVSGYSRPQDVVMTSFSSWGPTDDGRIKPDVVANGVNVLSSVASSNNAYSYISGTSMSAPNVTGSVMLLQEYYAQQHSGAFMRSATLKGILIHTADEVGADPGPDYQAGWGLVNMEKAASVITSNNTDQLIQENILNNSGTSSLPVVASGKGPLVVTICWTDPKGPVETGNPLNSTQRKLINDLDVRVKLGATTYMPWILNPSNRAAAATKGDNIRDNVEKIEIPQAIPGETYTIEVTHKGALERGSQAYSLIVSGVGGTAYCASAATNGAGGTRIDNVTIGSFTHATAGGCTTYTSYKDSTIVVEPNSTIPVNINMSGCAGVSPNKIVKVFVDFNNDGDFDDAGELIAESSAINGNAAFNGNATIPAGVTIGNYSILRIVIEETSTAADVQSCGSYTNGETRDYRVLVADPSKDVGILALVSPVEDECSHTHQYLTVRIKNFGSSEVSNIPVTATVMQGATPVITVTDTFPGTIPAFGIADYTIQGAFSTLPGVAYTVTTTTGLTGDQVSGNNQKVSAITIASAAAAPAGQAEICGPGPVYLKATNPGSDVFNWYDAPGATTPIATGASTSTPTITADSNYYLAKNDISPVIGPATKTEISSSGQYFRYNGQFITFNNSAPVLIESARLYLGYATKGAKIRFTVGRNLNFDNSTNSYSYTPVSSVVLNVYATDPTPQSGAGPGDPADTGAVFLLNLPVPSTGDHFINITQEIGDTTNIFRNGGITSNPYPIGIPGVFQLTGNSASYTGGNHQEFYYFFYNMKLRWADCASDRTTIKATAATAPTISLNGNVFTSSSATGNRWHLNGNPIAGATGQTYNASVSGTYKVVVTDGFGCALSSNEITATITGIPNIDPSEIGLKVLPNPNNGRFALQFKVDNKADLHINLTNALGQNVYQKIYPGFIGMFNNTVEAGKLSPGVYMLRVMHDKKQYMKKIIVR